jgi:hypothetical protein
MALLTYSFPQRAAHHLHYHWHHGYRRDGVRNEVREDEYGDHKHRQQRERRRICPHRPHDHVANLMQQPALSNGPAEGAAAAQQQQHVPV